MRRRAFLSACSLALVGTVAGCVEDDDSNGEPDEDPAASMDSSGPEATVEAYIAAIEDSDNSRLHALVHEDSPRRPLREAEDLAELSATLTESSVVEQYEDTATVDITVEFEFDDEETVVEASIELRKSLSEKESHVFSAVNTVSLWFSFAHADAQFVEAHRQ